MNRRSFLLGMAVVPVAGLAMAGELAPPAPLTAEERRRALEFIAFRKQFQRFRFFEPYSKQREFLALGAVRRERLLMAGNRVGKSHCGAYEAAVHATGMYPEWWKGRRFDGPTKGWVCGVTAQAVRDVCQAKLCGPPGVEREFGTGMIPKDKFEDKPTLGRGIPDVFDTLHVKHVSGGVSTIVFKSYEQGRQKFQGEGLDWIWFDEEPDLDVYSEGIARIGERSGISWMTFTPINGPTAVVLRYTDEPSPDRIVVSMTLDDIPVEGHISAADKAKIEAGYLPHEREARAKGIPMLGSGRVFTATEGSIIEPPIEHIPAYWTKIWGIDPGIGHPFGAALLIWDKDNDVLHLHHCFRMVDALPIVHCERIKKVAGGAPVAYPKDAADREKGTGEPLAAHYKKQGLWMLHEHATWPDGGMSTEAGIFELDERMRTGRFKVAAQLTEFFEEYRFYHRKNGQIVKIKDDIISAVRVAVMMKRFSRAVPLGAGAGRVERERVLAHGVDFDLFATGDA